MRQTHEQKVKMARKMMNTIEKEEHVSIFDSQAWSERREKRIQKMFGVNKIKVKK